MSNESNRRGTRVPRPSHRVREEVKPTVSEDTVIDESLEAVLDTNEDDIAATPTEGTAPEFMQVKYEEGRPVIEERELKGALSYLPHFKFYNQGLDVAINTITKGNIDKDIVQFYTPKLVLADALARKGSEWNQHIKHGEKLIGPQRPRLKSVGGHLAGKAAIEMVRNVSGSGGSLTYQLPHTGITLTMRPPLESACIDLEFKISQAATQVGLATTGLLLNNRSGVFSDIFIDFALEHITSANISAGADELPSLLKEYIDPFDYGPLIWGLMATKFPNGHPWEFTCVSETCGATREAVINFARMLWIDKSSLTEKQLDVLANGQRVLTEQQLLDYREEFKTNDSSVVTLTHGIKVHFGRSTMAEYTRSAGQWVADIERHYTNALSNYTTEARRQQYLQSQVQARRMSKYEYMVEKLSIPTGIEGEYDIIDGRDDITEALRELSTISDDYNVFEEGAIDFIDQGTVSMVAYPAHKCGSCGFEPETSEGTFRSLVPIAIDRLLFMLVQQRNMVMSSLGDA